MADAAEGGLLGEGSEDAETELLGTSDVGDEDPTAG